MWSNRKLHTTCRVQSIYEENVGVLDGYNLLYDLLIWRNGIIYSKIITTSS